MSSPAPKLSELQALAKSTLIAAAYFVAASTKIKVADADPDNGEQSVVIAEDGTKKNVIENRLRSIGFAVVVEPLLHWTPRDQSGSIYELDCILSVSVKVNPEKNKATTGAQVSIIEACTAVMATICKATRHPGGEFFKVAPEGGMLSQFDEGIFTYNIQFKKEALL